MKCASNNRGVKLLIKIKADEKSGGYTVVLVDKGSPRAVQV
jgi:hypothetical protein